jgi:hypothetical protein
VNLKAQTPIFDEIDFKDIEKVFAHGNPADLYYYFSAILLSHAYIEAMLQSIFFMFCITEGPVKKYSRKDIKKRLRTLDYNVLNQVLFDLTIINKDQSKRLQEFNNFRNRLTHQLAKSRYFQGFKPITEQEFRDELQDAKKLYKELYLINNGIIEKIAKRMAEGMRSSQSLAR